MKGELSKLNQIHLDYYRVVACTLHAFNQALENGVIKCFGECQLDIMTFHNYLFSCYAAQDNLGEIFVDVWSEATGQNYYDTWNQLQ